MNPDELQHEIEALPRFIALIQHPQGYKDGRWQEPPMLHEVVKIDDLKKLLEYVERESG